jgi:hypothetical protein
LRIKVVTRWKTTNDNCCASEVGSESEETELSVQSDSRSYVCE